MPPVWFYDLMYRWRAPWEMGARSELIALVQSGRVTPERLPPDERSTSAAGRARMPSSWPRRALTRTSAVGRGDTGLRTRRERSTMGASG
jgi:hypothetical protein